MQLLGICEEPLSLVMEFLPGGSLYSHLRREKELDAATTFKIVRGIARGMLHLVRGVLGISMSCAHARAFMSA